MFTVTIIFPGHGRYRGGCYYKCERFRDETKARDYYAEMLLKYPDNEVKLGKEINNGQNQQRNTHQSL